MNKIVLQNNNGVPVVSSREIAQRFGKEHKDVVIRIEGKVRSDGSKESGLIEGIMERGFPPAKYFIESLYLNRGKQYREYLMTRNGFSLLVMGFTGKEALEWKLKYIDAFNKMEDQLKAQNEKMLPITYKEALIQLLDQVEKNEQLEEERRVLLPKQIITMKFLIKMVLSQQQLLQKT